MCKGDKRERERSRRERNIDGVWCMRRRDGEREVERSRKRNI